MPAPSDPSLYELLEVSQAASAQEIEGAYERISGLVAPDSLAVYAMLDESEVDSLRAQVEQAYQTLRDPEQRAAYDIAQSQAQRSNPAAPGQRLRPLPASPLPLPEPSVQPKAAAWPVVQPQGPSARVATRLNVPAASPSMTSAAPASMRSGPAPAQKPQGGRKALRPTLNLEYGEALEVSGAVLRKIRESAQASLEDLSDITKISKRYLAAVEADDYANLPATVYVRGFVSEYARALGLEAREVAKSYMTQYQRQRAQSGK